MVIGSRDLSHEILLNNSKILSSNEEKLSDIFLDCKLNFESHIGSLCRKIGQKINVLARLKNYLTSDQRNLLLNSVIKSQFTHSSKTIHQKNLEFLAIEIYKFQNGLSPPFLNDIFFSRENSYNLRKFQELSTSTKNTVNFIEAHNCGT